MLLIAYLDCGTTPVLNTGVHLASASFVPVVGTIADFIESRLGTSGGGALLAPTLQALDAVPGLADLTIQTSDETDWTTLFAGVGTMGEVRASAR